jgi:acyl-CoA synthetase (AMP-forming)/AMP-acid ligase II
VLTYRELNSEILEDARQFAEVGLHAGDRIVVVLDGLELVLALLTLLRRTTVVPLSSAAAPREIAGVLIRLRPAALVTSATVTSARAAAQQAGVRVILVDEVRSSNSSLLSLSNTDVDRRTDARRPPRGESSLALHAGSPEPDQVALILSTSGTSGRPKLVPLTHDNVAAAAGATCVAYRLTALDRRLNVMPLFHVQGIVGSIVPSLLAGGSVVCAPRFDAHGVLDWIEAYDPTWFSASPAMYREFLIALSTRSRPSTSSLRFVRSGSGPLPASLRKQLEDALLLPVVESYGMTEAHQIASSPLPPGRHKFGTAGLPTGSEVAVMNDRGEMCPAGTPGELLIRGRNVTSRYLDDPARNATAFVDGWLRTEDVGYVDDEGYVSIAGRKSDIINRGGEKIAPAEVEDVLLEHPAVHEAAAFSVRHPVLDEDIAAAVVLKSGTDESLEQELRAFVRSRVAPFKVPRRIVSVASLPKTPAGKLRRADLASMIDTPAGANEVQSDVDPLQPTKVALAALWAGVLELEEVSPEDDFFALGGDSLQESRLRAVVAQVFQVALPATAIYEEASTVAGMADLVHRLQREANEETPHGSIERSQDASSIENGRGAV